jgi:hypothetical protein
MQSILHNLVRFDLVLEESDAHGWGDSRCGCQPLRRLEDLPLSDYVLDRVACPEFRRGDFVGEKNPLHRQTCQRSQGDQHSKRLKSKVPVRSAEQLIRSTVAQQ